MWESAFRWFVEGGLWVALLILLVTSTSRTAWIISYYLFRTWPFRQASLTPTSGQKGLKAAIRKIGPRPKYEWLITQEWAVSFCLINAGGFFVSLVLNMVEHHESGFWNTLLKNHLISGQIGFLALAAELVTMRRVYTPHIVLTPSEENRHTWLLSFGAALWANLLALSDSLTRLWDQKIGYWHGRLWLLENGCCISFFGILFCLMLLRRYSVLTNIRIAWLWPVATIALIALIVDAFMAKMF